METKTPRLNLTKGQSQNKTTKRKNRGSHKLRLGRQQGGGGWRTNSSQEFSSHWSRRSWELLNFPPSRVICGKWQSHSVGSAGGAGSAAVERLNQLLHKTCTINNKELFEWQRRFKLRKMYSAHVTSVSALQKLSLGRRAFSSFLYPETHCNYNFPFQQGKKWMSYHLFYLNPG